MKQTILAAVVTAAFFGMAAAQAGQTVQLEDCGKKADAFAFIVDASGSMMQEVGEVKEKARKEYEELIVSGQYKARDIPVPPANEAVDEQRRIELAKKVSQKIANRIPAQADMVSALYAIAPYAELVPLEKRSTEEFSQKIEEKLNTNLEVFGRPTWMGERAFNRFAAKADGIQNFILITDGNFGLKEKGKHSPVDGLNAFYQANPGSCVHIISAAYTPKEKAGVEAMATVNSCAKIAELEVLASNEEVLQGFVEDTIYKDCSQVGVIEIEDVYFDFDKSIVTAESAERLNKAVEILKNRPDEKVTIVGWTDWTGSDAYNAGLSERRAQAVKDYFVSQGLDASRFEVVGKGKSFKFSNHTGDGRHKNRRVELIFK